MVLWVIDVSDKQNPRLAGVRVPAPDRAGPVYHDKGPAVRAKRCGGYLDVWANVGQPFEFKQPLDQQANGVVNAAVRVIVPNAAF